MAEADSHQGSAINTLLKASKFGAKEILAFIIVTLSVAFVAFHMYAGMFGHPEAHFFRSIHLTLILVLCWIVYPLKRKSWMEKANGWTIIDVICIILTLVVEIYYLWDVAAFQYRQLSPNQTDIYMAIILWALVLEGTRRALGPPMVIVALVFTFQALFSNKLFWIFYGPATSLKSLALDMYMQEGGIFGLPIGTIASFVVLFLIFGAFLEESGTGRTFIDLALAGFGAKIGGPAKAAVVGSAFFGMLSGSSVANVTTTGTFTIPLMKKVGFANKYAGGVEACASTGGMFTPPIMGATAFVVAAYLGIPYVAVAIAAAGPALCYYCALFAQVDFYSRKQRIRPLSKEEMPNVKKVLKNGFHLLLPIIILVYLLVIGYTAGLACFWAIVALFAVSFLRKNSRPKAESIIRVCELAARATIVTSMACAAAGIIVCTTTLSGVGLKLGVTLVSIASGQLWLALLLAAVLAIILGMGLTTTAVYVIMVVTVIPAILEMGVLPIAAHLYALFWGVMSNVIPPVAIASFAAAGIAKSSPMETAVQGFKIALPGLLVFASFVYNPALLCEGPVLHVIINIICCIIGVVGCTAAIQGHAFTKVNVLFRLILFAMSIVVLSPRWDLSIGGAAVIMAILLLNRKMAKKNLINYDVPDPAVAGGAS